MRGEQGQAGYWIPGAVSVTFRDMHLGADEVLELMAETGLETIEWSENVHLMENDPAAARDLRNRSRRAAEPTFFLTQAAPQNHLWGCERVFVFRIR